MHADEEGRAPGHRAAAAAAVVPTVGASSLESCLRALASQSRPFSRVIVVDDGGRTVPGEGLGLSADGPAGVATEVLRLPRRGFTAHRRGFAAAANAGIRAALADPATAAVALVNDDVRLDPSWNEAALSALLAAPEIGSCATVVRQARNPALVDSTGIEWEPGAMAADRAHGQPLPRRTASPAEVWGASAAAALYRREMLDAIGLFDESFGSYQEDVELALRARANGWRCMLAPGASAEHDGRASNRPFPGGGTWADFFNARNRLTLVVTTVPSDEWRQWRAILRRHAAALLTAAGEGRAIAVWAGALHAFVRLPSSLRRRRRMSRTGMS